MIAKIILILVAIVIIYVVNFIIAFFIRLRTDKLVLFEVNQTKAENNDVSIHFRIQNKYFPIRIGWISIKNGHFQKSQITVPSGFKASETTVLDRDSFEGDLSILRDKYKENEITDEIIKKEEYIQYQDYLKMMDDRKEDLFFTGNLRIFPKNSKDLIVNGISDKIESITIGYNMRIGLIGSSDAFIYKLKKEKT